MACEILLLSLSHHFLLLFSSNAGHYRMLRLLMLVFRALRLFRAKNLQHKVTKYQAISESDSSLLKNSILRNNDRKSSAQRVDGIGYMFVTGGKRFTKQEIFC